MHDLTPYGITIPITLTHEGPRCWKRYRTHSGKLRWRNYKRDVTGGITKGEMIMDTIKEIAAAAKQSLNEATISAWLPGDSETPDPSTGLYELARTACADGGLWAFLRVRPSGAREMVGCACHFTPEKFGVA